jgi:hypothetical protein
LKFATHPRNAVTIYLQIALPWVLGLLFVYILKAAIYIVGFTIVLLIAIVQAVRAGNT